MDPSVLLKLRSPQWSDPLDDYSKLQTLRQMMDQRRIREQQYQLQQQAMQEHARKAQYEQQDRDRAEQFRQAIGRGATLRDLAAIDPHLTAEWATKEATRETARLAQEAAQRKAQTEKNQQVADVMYGVRGRGQPSWDEAVMMDLLKPKEQQLGLGQIGQETSLAPTEQQFQAQYSLGYNPAQTQTLLSNEARAEAARTEEAFKRSLDPFHARKAIAEANTAEQISTGTQPLTPYQQTQLDQRKEMPTNPDALNAWLSDPRRSPDELARGKVALKAMGDFRAATAAAGQVSVGNAADLTPQAIDMMANNFATTGQMPPLGMGKAATELRRKIINRAGEMHPTIDLAGNQAAYAANKQSLGALQKSSDSLHAFEETAKKNLDLFLTTAKGVIDTTIPALNLPVRLVTRNMVGDEKFLAFQAARRVAVNEIAKITSNPNLTGQMSDSARKEVESFIPEDATIKEIYKVASVLKQDMENRRVSIDEQLQAIKGRIGSGDQPKPTKATVKMRAPNGDVRDVPVDQVQHYESRGAKRVP